MSDRLINLVPAFGGQLHLLVREVARNLSIVHLVLKPSAKVNGVSIAHLWDKKLFRVLVGVIDLGTLFEELASHDRSHIGPLETLGLRLLHGLTLSCLRSLRAPIGS